jgi:hypothetical protein
MNDTVSSSDQKQTKGDPSGTGRPEKRPSLWRAVIRVAVAALIGFIAVATVHQMLYEPTSTDGTYEWTLRWPGIPPGAKFTTRSDDDSRRFLEILLADAGPDWQGPLAQQGMIEVQLSCPAYPSLWTVLKWRFGLLKGPQGFAAERTVLTVCVNRLAKPSVRYEVVRIGPDGDEVMRGTFETFPEAQKAVLDELALAMDDVQT